jgi:hypothetical protein
MRVLHARVLGLGMTIAHVFARRLGEGHISVLIAKQSLSPFFSFNKKRRNLCRLGTKKILQLPIAITYAYREHKETVPCERESYVYRVKKDVIQLTRLGLRRR